MARFTCHDPHNIYDVVPCDLVASTILVCACALVQVATLLACDSFVLLIGLSICMGWCIPYLPQCPLFKSARQKKRKQGL
jgi:hypothetical protein